MEPATIAMPPPFVRTRLHPNATRFVRSPVAAVTEAILLVALIGWFDYWTGDFAITLFYFGPVALATWFGGRLAGWSIALLCGVTVLVSNLMYHGLEQHLTIKYVNGGMLVLVCGTVVELISSLRRAQDRLRTRLELRTVSLAEVHHRVKNNLQIVSSLLLLQSEKFTDSQIRTVFAECRDRINAMARLHEQLYSDVELSQLDFATHLRELAEMLVRSHTPPGCKLILSIHADRVPLDLDRGILLSLVAHELLLNPLKHAFRERTKGNLEVELRWSASQVMLTIRDNGSGFSPELQSNGDDGSSGLHLVRAMSQQLDAELTIGNDPAGGTCATISFPAEVSRSRRELPQNSTLIPYVEDSHFDRRRRSADCVSA